MLLIERDLYGSGQMNSRYKKLQGKVLIVDDEKIIRDILYDFLIEFGFQVDDAFDGQDAYEKVCENNDYDYVLTDLAMPKMDGVELIKKLKALPDFKSKIIVITGLLTQDAKQLAVDGLVNKPFSMDIIYDQLKN